MAIKGIDLGNYNLKTSDGLIIRSKFTTEAETCSGEHRETIEYNGVTYYIGEGEFDINLVKAEKDMIPLFLYALAKKNHHNNVNVVLGLPAAQFKESKETMSNKYQGTFKFKLNGDLKTVNVDNVKVYPEGVGAFYMLDDECKKGDVIITDIGGRTINLAWFRNGKLMKVATVNHGMFKVYDLILSKVNPGGIYPGIDIQYIQDNLKTGINIHGKPVDLSHQKAAIRTVVNEVYQMFYLKEFPVDIAKCIKLSGGGASTFYEEFNNRHHNVEVVDNSIFANANGFNRVGVKLWPNS